MKRSVALFMIGSFAVVVTAAVAQVSLRYRMVRTGYALGERLAEQRALEEEGRRLRLVLSLALRPERIEKLAHDQLGMVRPDHIRVVRTATEVAAGEGCRPGVAAVEPCE
jgi:cell division protein FtsL